MEPESGPAISEEVRHGECQQGGSRGRLQGECHDG